MADRSPTTRTAVRKQAERIVRCARMSAKGGRSVHPVGDRANVHPAKMTGLYVRSAIDDAARPVSSHLLTPQVPEHLYDAA